MRRLAALTVYRLGQRFALALDARDRLHRDAFVEAHLRASADAEEAGWLNDAPGSFDGQTDAHLALATAANLSVIYVATGNAATWRALRIRRGSSAVSTSRLRRRC